MTDILNEKLLTFIEVLRKANESADPVKFLKEAMTKDQRITTILGYAMNPKFKMGMPDGIPPYIPGNAPLGLAELEILNLFRNIYVLYETKTPRAKKEQMYIQWLEKMNEDEAALMISIKDKQLHTIFDKVTEAVLVESLGWSWETYQKMQ